MEQLDPFKPVTQNFQKGTLVITASIEVFFLLSRALGDASWAGPSQLSAQWGFITAWFLLSLDQRIISPMFFPPFARPDILKRHWETSQIVTMGTKTGKKANGLGSHNLLSGVLL